MAHDQILLQLHQILLRDGLVVQGPETGVHTIDRCIALLQSIGKYAWLRFTAFTASGAKPMGAPESRMC
jgi:hypothetical protein